MSTAIKGEQKGVGGGGVSAHKRPNKDLCKCVIHLFTTVVFVYNFVVKGVELE